MQVKCAAYSYKEEKWQELDVSSTLRVYPCCAYQGYYELNPWDDEKFKSLPIDWNDLKKNTIENIKETMFTILNAENFDSGNCPQRCKNICGVTIKEKSLPPRDNILVR